MTADSSSGATPVRVALGLGSNLGDRLAHLSTALQALREETGVIVAGCSSLVETDPVGGPEQPDFLNAVVLLDTTLAPVEVLALAHRLEQDAGRVRVERWGPRTLDVDVLAYDEVTSDDPVLTLPHPRATERAFVLVPWAEVDPGFVLSGRPVAAWASAIGDDGVRGSDLSWEAS